MKALCIQIIFRCESDYLDFKFELCATFPPTGHDEHLSLDPRGASRGAVHGRAGAGQGGLLHMPTGVACCTTWRDLQSLWNLGLLVVACEHFTSVLFQSLVMLWGSRQRQRYRTADRMIVNLFPWLTGTWLFVCAGGDCAHTPHQQEPAPRRPRCGKRQRWRRQRSRVGCRGGWRRFYAGLAAVHLHGGA